MRQFANFDIVLSHIANKISGMSDHLLLRSMTNLYRRRESESSGFQRRQSLILHLLNNIAIRALALGGYRHRRPLDSQVDTKIRVI